MYVNRKIRGAALFAMPETVRAGGCAFAEVMAARDLSRCGWFAALIPALPHGEGADGLRERLNPG